MELNSISIGSIVLLILSLISPIGFLFQSRALKGLGITYMISPLPIVFSDTNGYEAFGSKFKLKFIYKNGAYSEREVTPYEGSKIQGPYNRRNVYGAVIGYAPRLPEPLVSSVLRHGFCRPDILVNEFQLDNNISKVILEIQDQTRQREHLFYHFEVTCIP